MKVRAPLIVAACSLILASAGAHAADLITVYQRALQNDPQIREADALRLASRESKPQALSALLPQFDATGSYNKIDQDSGRIQFIRDPNNPNSELVPINVTSSSDLKAKQYDLTLRQSLFRWDQWMTLKRADAEVAQAEADYQFAQQDLIQRTSVRYFDVLAAQDTVDAAEAALEAFSRQLEQANKRFEVGLIAITDVQEARAAHDQAAALPRHGLDPRRLNPGRGAGRRLRRIGRALSASRARRQGRHQAGHGDDPTFHPAPRRYRTGGPAVGTC